MSEPSQLQVMDEVGWLHRVLVCSPGKELSLVPPAERERYLVDDLLEPERAQAQHGEFRNALRILMRAGPEGQDSQVMDVREALERGLGLPQVESQAKRLFEEVCQAEKDAYPKGERFRKDVVLNALQSLYNDGRMEDLVDALIGGLPAEKPRPGHPLFMLGPAPNAIFTRDYQVTLGRGVAISAMAKEARRREPAIARFLFATLPEMRSMGCPFDGPGLVDAIQQETRRAGGEGQASPQKSPFGGAGVAPNLRVIEEQTRSSGGRALIEGGDVMVLSPGVIAMGIGERTSWRGAEALALGLRCCREQAPESFPFHTLLVMELPRKRAMMHLDTVFTLVDHGLALAFPPLTFPGAREEMDVMSCDLASPQDAPLTWTWEGPFSEVMARTLGSFGRPLILAAGGGEKRAQQHREQWSDGCNAVAVGPGVAVAYSRNRETTAVLENLNEKIRSNSKQIAVVGAQQFGGPDPTHCRPFQTLDARGLDEKQVGGLIGNGDRVLVCLDSSELGRARGGPHCMTMALSRRS